MKKRKGKFIVIEGLDGSGGTTQVDILVKKLKKEGNYSYATSEPTDNIIGGVIRAALTGVVKLPAESLQLLFSADRGHHLKRMILPALENGSSVVCDRYIWSTVAFGSLSMDRSWLLSLQKHFMIPDLTILLKVDPKECIKRIKKNRFDFELFEKEEELKKVWRTYMWLKRKYPKKILVVDGNLSLNEVSERIEKTVIGFFGKNLSEL